MLERVWRKGNPLTLLVGMQTSTATMKNNVEMPLKTGNRTAILHSNSMLGIHAEETRIERDTCTWMFIAALFIIARTWKQPRCPSADEWIRKLWYIHTMEYFSRTCISGSSVSKRNCWSGWGQILSPQHVPRDIKGRLRCVLGPTVTDGKSLADTPVVSLSLPSLGTPGMCP